jgi:hypothetical protein
MRWQNDILLFQDTIFDHLTYFATFNIYIFKKKKT